MKKFLFAALVFFCLVSWVAAEGNAGKLYIFSKNAEDKIFLDGVQVGTANAWIEAIPEGEYKLTVVSQDGKTVFFQKVNVKGGETTTIVVSEAGAQQQQAGKEEFDLTPTVAISIGYQALGFSASSLLGGASYSNQPMAGMGVFSFEINKNIFKNLDVQLGVGSFWGAYSGSNYANIFPIYYNWRYAWKTGGFFNAMYLGIGENISGWSMKDASGNYYSSTYGYQYFIGGYFGPWGYFGNIQTELGYTYLAAKTSSSTASAKGVYFKAGWAF